MKNTSLRVYYTFWTGPDIGEYNFSSEFPTVSSKFGASLIGLILLAVKKVQPIAANEWLANIKPPIVPFLPGKKDQAPFNGSI